MSTSTYLIGDVFERLSEIPDGSVDLVMTSPPFLALRSYLPADHPDKAKEIGGEPAPAEFIDTLLALTAEWGRVLAPHGSICVELGDTYSGSSAEGSDQKGSSRYPNGRGMAGLKALASKSGPGWPLDKSLAGIPHLYHLSLAYGRNVLTGEASPAGMWRVRNVVAWVRPNPPVGFLGDKFRPGTSYMTIATRARDRYFDLDAVRTPLTQPEQTQASTERRRAAERGGGRETNDVIVQNQAGAPPLDWWEIPTQPYAGSHYATFPPALCTKPIRAMCPHKVCTTCGEPSRRIVEKPETTDDGRTRDPIRLADSGGARHGHRTAQSETIGWTDCGHDSWRTGTVLDPFAGSGTTLAVATGEGRAAIGIDLDERNAELARERVGMFLTIDDRPAIGETA